MLPRAPLIAILLCLTTAAHAGPAEDAAVLASETLQTHCAGLLKGDVSRELTGLKEVAGAWEAVRDAYTATQEPYLLYWRGTLAQCLDYDDNARADLEEFWVAAADQAGLAEQRRDAQRRLRTLGVTVGAETPRPGPATGAGVGLLGGGGILVGLTGWQFSELARLEDRYRSGETRPEDLATVRADGEAAAVSTNAFGAAAMGMGVAGTTLLVIDLVRVQTAGKGRTTVAALPTVVPLGDGAALVVGGRW